MIDDSLELIERTTTVDHITRARNGYICAQTIFVCR